MYSLKRQSSFRLSAAEPYNFELTVRKPAGWSWFTPYEIWEQGTIWSGFWFTPKAGKKFPVGVRATERNGIIAIDLFSAEKPDKSDLNILKTKMANSLGVNEDLKPLYRLMAKNNTLKPLARRLRGMREGWGNDIFPSLTLAVLLQMAPIKRSQAMWDCVIRSFGATIKFDNKQILLWPNEETIASAKISELKKCKLGYRAKNLKRLAQQLVKGFPGVQELALMTPEAAKEKLMELYGIGEYSAGFATPHPSFTLDVWSVKIFHRIIFGRPAPAKDPRSAIERTNAAATRLWGAWRGYVFVYVLNDLPYIEKTFGIPVT